MPRLTAIHALLVAFVMSVCVPCAPVLADESAPATVSAAAIFSATPVSEAPATPDAAPPASRTIVSVSVFPKAINLSNQRDRQSVVLQATYNDGVTIDVTANATFKLDHPNLASIEGNTLHPKADGETTLHVTHEDTTLDVPVAITQAAVNPDISFRLDVMPIFMRAGCNTGSCHGSARGKDGFHLSLFGYDPAGDYSRITRELAGRRVNLALPAQSLLVEKSIGSVPHSGGKRFEKDAELYNTMTRWIEAGARDDETEVAKPVSLEILPRKAVLESGTSQHVTVRAHYSDGTDRDVTKLALFMSNNDVVAGINDEGSITAGQRGEAFVMARFATFTVGSQVIVIPPNLDYTNPNTPANNYVDELVNEKLHHLRIVPSGLCSDEVFIRRAHLDIVGTLPEPDRVAAFVASDAADKREKLVDELLDRKEFVELWVMKWAELLQIRSGDQVMSYKSALLYYNWLQSRIAENVPFNEIVQELLASTGGTFTSPATNYYQVERDTLKVAENVAQVFMGMRIQCAQCHNHPFDRWTMDDYYSFAAFFSQVGRKRTEDPRELIVFNSNRGEVQHPVSKQNMQPKFLGGDVPDVSGKDRREVMAKWLASPENPYFARNLANIVWAHFFGIGIIDPVDDVRVSNPASNPELLDELAKRFTEYNYDFKRLVRDICTSRTYQLSSQTNPTNELDTTNFSHASIRRIRAEVLLDAISQVTQTKNKFKGLPLGARAVQIADGQVSTYFLTTFGRAKRDTVCSCEVVMEPNLSQALHLLNGDTVNKKIKQGDVVKSMLAAGNTPQQVIDHLYRAALSREPTDAEREKLTAAFADYGDDTQQALEDIFWAVLNSKEFIFNH